jgi:hypothetical protein
MATKRHDLRTLMRAQSTLVDIASALDRDAPAHQSARPTSPSKTTPKLFQNL